MEVNDHPSNETKPIWDSIWERTVFDLDTDRKRLKNELSEKRWRVIERHLVKRFGTLTNLSIVEIGAGIGDYSLLLAQNGANVTLLDYSDKALALAKNRFASHGLPANFIQTNIFESYSDFSNQFDVSMSFGLVEHFTGPDRTKIFLAHKEVLNTNGLTVISLPNALCLPYRYWKYQAQRHQTWEYGLEIPFTRNEVYRIARTTGIKIHTLSGSSFFESIYNFLLKNRLPQIKNSLSFESFLDDYFGYALTLIGEREKPIDVPSTGSDTTLR